MAVYGVNQQLSEMINRFAYVRTGTVTAVDPFFVTVSFAVASTEGEEVMELRAAYVRQSEPEVDDTVAVVRQGASWFVLGTTSATGGNLVQNPSFEEVDSLQKPVGWILYAVAGVPSFEAVPMPELAVDGTNVLEMVPASGASATGMAYSLPIAVVPGQQWELSVYVNGQYPAENPNTADVSLRALWFADADDLYPTTAAADSTIASITNITEGDTMSVMRGTVTVPGGAVFMRVGLRAVMSAYTGTVWDFVTARQVG